MYRNPKTFTSFTDAYLSVINDILHYGSWVDGILDSNSVGSYFGTKTRRTKELLNYNFIVANSRDRYLRIKNRQVNYPYLLSNFLWALQGTKNALPILKFNEKGGMFLNSRNELYSALGPHLFCLKDGNFPALEKIESLLKIDPTTRRAVIQFFSNDSLSFKNKDVPCLNHFHFFLRNNRLHLLVIMRSQNALKLLPYDFFLFSMIHEGISVRLKVELGDLLYSSNSLHIYEDEIPEIGSLEKENIATEMLEMTSFDDKTILTLRKTFQKLAIDFKKNFDFNIQLEKILLDDYWKDLIKYHFT